MNFKASFYCLIGWFAADVLVFGPPPEGEMIAAFVVAALYGKLTAKVNPVNNERGERL